MEQNKTVPVSKSFEWSEAKNNAAELYTNLIHLTWTLYDIRLVLGQLKSARPGSDNSGFFVEQQGSVTMSWSQAKVLRDMLTDQVARYEKVNGEIKPINLAPSE